MTVRELAGKLGVSVSTVYRHIKRGLIKAVKIGGRWKIQQEKEMDWNSQVHKQTAIQDGLKPEDFDWSRWPVSNVRLINSESRYALFFCLCDIPKDTPLDNQYDENNSPLPDPVGITLAKVKLELYDADTNELLNTNTTLPFEGECRATPKDGSRFWNVLTPGSSIQVKLVAYPMFYYLKEDGSAMNAYAVGHQGYFKGDEVKSQTYRLDMDQDGNVKVNE